MNSLFPYKKIHLFRVFCMEAQWIQSIESVFQDYKTAFNTIPLWGISVGLGIQYPRVSSSGLQCAPHPPPAGHAQRQTCAAPVSFAIRDKYLARGFA